MSLVDETFRVALRASDRAGGRGRHEHVLRHHPDLARAWHSLGVAHQARGDPHEREGILYTVLCSIQSRATATTIAAACSADRSIQRDEKALWNVTLSESNCHLSFVRIGKATDRDPSLDRFGIVIVAGVE